jgi:hypothetical protein
VTEKSLKLRLFRVQNRVKLVELAKQSGIHYTVLSLIENGWRPLKKDQAESLIRAYRKMNVEAEKTIRLLTVA